MSTGEYTNWAATAVTSTFLPSYTTTAGYGYNPAGYPPPLRAEGWRCPSCELVMAPWVPYHQCADEPEQLNKDDGEAGVTG
jgi:hypothetical protein